MIWLEFEENEKKRLAKEAAYAEAEREHVQVHNYTPHIHIWCIIFLFVMYYFSIFLILFFSEEMEKLWL